MGNESNKYSVNEGGNKVNEIIHVALIDRHQLFREGVKLIIQENTLFHIVADSDQYEVLEQVTALYQIDILLIDVRILMDYREGVERIIEQHDTKVIVLANEGEESYVTEAVKIGIHGYLLKEMDKISFIHAIEMVIDGEAYIHPNVTSDLVKDYRRLIEGEHCGSEQSFEPPYHLYTKRECEILQLLTDGQSNREIAETLEISEKTVKNHVSSLFKKMQVHDRTQAVVTAIRNNWVQL